MHFSYRSSTAPLSSGKEDLGEKTNLGCDSDNSTRILEKYIKHLENELFHLRDHLFTSAIIQNQECNKTLVEVEDNTENPKHLLLTRPTVTRKLQRKSRYKRKKKKKGPVITKHRKDTNEASKQVQEHEQRNPMKEIKAKMNKDFKDDQERLQV